MALGQANVFPTRTAWPWVKQTPSQQTSHKSTCVRPIWTTSCPSWQWQGLRCTAANSRRSHCPRDHAVPYGILLRVHPTIEPTKNTHTHRSSQCQQCVNICKPWQGRKCTSSQCTLPNVLWPCSSQQRLYSVHGCMCVRACMHVCMPYFFHEYDPGNLCSIQCL
jgi:hypothetical protein